MSRLKYGEYCDLVIDECRGALSDVDPQAVECYVEMLLIAKRVFFVGTGRVHLSVSSAAVRFRHFGIDTFVVGQVGLPPIGSEDLLVTASGSGESVVPVAMAKLAKYHGANIAHIGSNPRCTLTQISDLFVRIPANTKLATEGERRSRQPMTSLFEQAVLLLNDVVAGMIMSRRSLVDSVLWGLHSNLE